MKAGIYYNKNRYTENIPNLEKIAAVCRGHGIECRLVNSVNDLDGLDILVVLGGDGTILTVASECARRHIKILGVNYGHVGFLTEFEQSDIDKAFKLISSNHYNIVKRMMLEVDFCGSKYAALNDIVIQRSTNGQSFSNTVGLTAEINGAIVDNFLADGIIVSTPTGSTAYSLSAGGSILAPDLSAFIMTPICAHSLHSRPVVFSSNSILKITPYKADVSLNLTVDGKVIDVINDNRIFTIKKSDLVAEFICCGDTDFFNKLSIKLNIWSK